MYVDYTGTSSHSSLKTNVYSNEFTALQQKVELLQINLQVWTNEGPIIVSFIIDLIGQVVSNKS